MADATVIVEGKIKFREGKKWKPRWCILKKPSPVADRLQVYLYKDLTEFAKNESKPKSVFALDAFFGLDAGFAYDRESHVLALICHKSISLMAFELRENMIQFEIKIRQNMGEEHQFPVKVVKAPSSARLPKDPIRLMIYNMRFCLIAHVPPKILIAWNIEDLRRFGTREGKFCFEGGTRCGKGSGVFALQSEQAEDIADIVNLASTGKLVNCHRKFKNRSSQIDFNSHLIADMSCSPSSSSIRHPHHPDIANRTPPQGALPVTLNCCHDSQTGSAESEDWSWYKRHSVSVMDHRRITALREKGFTDNREQLVVAIYDVPPKQERRIDDNSWDNLDEPNYSYPRPDPENMCTTSSSSTSICSTPTSNSAVLSCGHYGNYKRIVPTEREYMNSDSNEQRQAAIYKWQSASTELLDTKVSSLDEMLAGNGHKDSSCKNSLAESLRHLKKQESDLQMEMVLLDEILQNCSVTSLELSEENSHSETNGTLQHLVESGWIQKLEDTPSEPDQKLKDIPSEPLMSARSPDFTIISGNISSLKPAKSDLVQNANFRKLDRTAVLKLNTSMPEGTPVSPLFYAKFNNIPPTSHLNAPLPYVNLSRYDDESYSHVHLPGSADSVPVVRMSSMQVLHDGQNHGLRDRNFSLTSLHTPISSSNFVDVNYHRPDRNQMFQHKMIDKAEHNSNSATQVHQWEQTGVSKHDEILVVKMNNQPEYTEQNVYKSCHPFLQNFGGTSQQVHSDIVNILTTDANLQDENHFSTRDIYENLPLRNDNTLPPELPPKGPALLKRLKNSNKCIESEKISHAMRYQHSQGARKDIDTRNYRTDCHAHQVLSDKEPQTSADTREDNYLIMGSPKIKHRELAAKPNASFDSSFSAQHRSHCENATEAAKNELYGRQVSCVGRHDCSHDDEIYLELESNQELHHKDLYISEADLKLSPMVNSRMFEESTYMEMANVANKKSLLVKHAGTPQKLMNITHLEENAYFISSPLSHVPPPPPRPLSLKIRHNSDSGVSPKSHEISTSDEHRDNRPKAKPVKSPTRVYTKIKKTSQQSQVSEPPMPFPNLIDFSKKMSDSRSTYVNTCLDVDKNLVPQEVFINRDVPLPEPVKEGFLARFKRRSSRDKNGAQANEKYANSKIRNSVLERSMSEHDSSKATKEEKSTRLKVGRRRSSSFPNQLSYQESLDTSADSMLKQTASSSSSFSSASSRPKPDQSESSSIRDFSDDSDMSPLLKRGDKRVDPQQLTVLHVRRSDHSPVNPYIQTCKSPIKINQLYADSSKTDDEKLIEIIQQKGQSKKPVVYQRSSSLELKKPSPEHEQGCYLKLPLTMYRKERRSSFEKAIGCSSSFDSDIPYTPEAARSLDSETSSCSDRSKMSCLSSLSFSLDKEHTPPALPPKIRPYQGPLSPVIEIVPLIPVHTEPIYVEMDKLLSSSDVGDRREKAHTASHNRPVEEDKDCNTNISDVETKAGRLSQLASYEITDEVSYKSVIVHIDTAHLAQCDHDEETPSDVAAPACTLSHHIIHLNDISECTHPAKSILRPRSGQEYVFIQRISITSPVSFACLPTNSSFVNSVFSELQKPDEKAFHSYQPEPPCAVSGHNVSSHYLTLPHNTPQKSPSTSSGKETVRSSASMHSPSWEPDPSHHRYEGRSHAKSVNDTSSQASTPRPVFSPHPALSASPTKWKSAHATDTEDNSIFFPAYMTFSATTPPSSPLGPYAHTPSAQHTPTYVNQEFVDRHNHAASSSHTVNTSGSYSSNSPIRAGVHSLKSLIFKDSSRHSPRGSRETRLRTRHSESDANKIEKHSLTLPPSKHVPSSVQRSHSDPKKSETEEKLQLPSGSTSSNYRELPQKVYDKFADSSIISRRRRRYVTGNKLSAEATLINSSAESSLKDISQEHSPVMRSSGYKNIDSINAASIASVSSPSPRTPSSGLDTSHLGHTLQLGSILESRISPSESIHSSGSSVFVDRNRHSASFVFSGGGSVTVENSVTLPHSSSPPPPVPWRKRISSSPVSSCSLNSVISSSDVSDSPPSYFAPSPPCTPPPPPLPPRMPQSPPTAMVTSSPIEPDAVSHFSEEEQELNYIEIDMTKSAETVVLPPPLAYSRRSKRVRQQKEKDYAKLRYAVIDHRATKALQQARQEHVQCRDSSLWHMQPKDANLERGASHLSRINSVPASKRKQLSVMQRERKLSSGSIESC